MNWMQLAVDLTREAFKTSEPEKPKPANADLGAALAQEFQTIHRNMEAVVQAVNLQNVRLEATVRRQRFWNYALAAGLVIVLVIAILRH